MPAAFKSVHNIGFLLVLVRASQDITSGLHRSETKEGSFPWSIEIAICRSQPQGVNKYIIIMYAGFCLEQGVIFLYVEE